MCLCLLQVLQEWDDSKFNFTKALQKEVLFQFEASDMPAKGSSFVPLAPVTGDCQLASLHACACSCGQPHPESHARLWSAVECIWKGEAELRLGMCRFSQPGLHQRQPH